jgi:Rod binding domain-containing protein
MGSSVTQGITYAPVAAPVTRTAEQAKVHRVAKQFEAMFMTEMLHQAHSQSHAAGVFRTGTGESTMQPFMDQALGEAAASRGGMGLAKSIERLLSGPAAARSGK